MDLAELLNRPQGRRRPAAKRRPRPAMAQRADDSDVEMVPCLGSQPMSMGSNWWGAVWRGLHGVAT